MEENNKIDFENYVFCPNCGRELDGGNHIEPCEACSELFCLLCGDHGICKDCIERHS